MLSRTKPSGATLEVIPTLKTYTVIFDGDPFTLRQTPKGYGTVRYHRTTFQIAGRAKRLADKLNAFFETDAFTVVER